MSTLETIKSLMQERLHLPAQQLQPGQTLDMLGIDSLALIEFMFEIENALGISFDEEKVSVTTVQDVVDLVDSAISKRDGLIQAQAT